ncbi:MAG TPA: hypothetical protein EYG18_03050 [Micavibrio sp.]|nr:hypothetical protein [Micavibrio sp.]
MSELIDIRAENAQRVLDNPEFKRAFTELREAIFIQIESADITDAVMRDKLMLSAQLLQRVKRSFEDTVATGKLDADELQRKRITNRRGM